jgi:NAD(P)-dependent dehydrogenase (short-subunit alcohol dehydrogenase family)
LPSFRCRNGPYLCSNNKSFAAICNISGRPALRGNSPPGLSGTGPAKAAEVRFYVDLATELAEFGIRMNCMIPGVVQKRVRDCLRKVKPRADNGKLILPSPISTSLKLARCRGAKLGVAV